MTDREQLLSLAERVEASAGPDRELDVAIGLTGKFYIAEPRYPGAEPMIGYIDVDGSRVEPGNGSHDSLVPTYTASLDAAMTLVPEGWHVLLERWSDGRGRAEASTAGQTIGLWAATPALALTAAALRALAHVKEEG